MIRKNHNLIISTIFQFNISEKSIKKNHINVNKIQDEISKIGYMELTFFLQ